MSLSPFRYVALGVLIAGAPLLAADCSQLPDINQLKQLLAKAPNAGGRKAGYSTVNRSGQ